MPFRYASPSDIPPTDSEARIPLDCPVCGIHTDSDIVAYFESPQTKWHRLSATEMKVFNYLVRCTQCHSGLLIWWFYGELVRGQKITEGKLVFPLPCAAFRTKELSRSAIPGAIFEDMCQAELALAAGAHFGAGLLLRRACQYICRDRQIPEDAGGLKAQMRSVGKEGGNYPEPCKASPQYPHNRK